MTGEKISIKALCLDPLDILSFRDGRPFGEGSYAKSGLPLPQTLSGALRTALLFGYGCDFERLGEALGKGCPLPQAVDSSGAPSWIARIAFRGPWLAEKKSGKFEVYVPLPANIHKPKGGDGELFTLKPLAKGCGLPGWCPPENNDQLRPLWATTHVRTERAAGWLSLGGLKSFLSGKSVDIGQVILAGGDAALFSFAERTGIGIDPECLSAQEGLIYGSGYLSLGPGICFYAEAVLPPDAPSNVLENLSVLPFGGEGRRAAFSIVEPVRWPEALPTSSGDKPFILLTAPAFFKQGWRPSALSAVLTGAAVPGYLPVSGWDLARGGPKPTRFAVPAGSVYFMDTNENELPGVMVENEDDFLAGYGCYLKGVWTDGTK